jgi:excisionase family DNA binding protein
LLKTYSAAEAADVLHVHVNRIFEWAARGELAGVKLGRAWLFREQDIEAFIDRKLRERQMGKAA